MHWDNGWHDSAGTGWWLFMALMMLAFLVSLAWLLVTVVRHGGPAEQHTAPKAPNSLVERPGPEDILNERLARGEIDVDEYDKRVDALRAKRQG